MIYLCRIFFFLFAKCWMPYNSHSSNISKSIFIIIHHSWLFKFNSSVCHSLDEWINSTFNDIVQIKNSWNYSRKKFICINFITSPNIFVRFLICTMRNPFIDGLDLSRFFILNQPNRARHERIRIEFNSFFVCCSSSGSFVFVFYFAILWLLWVAAFSCFISFSSTFFLLVSTFVFFGALPSPFSGCDRLM